MKCHKHNQMSDARTALLTILSSVHLSWPSYLIYMLMLHSWNTALWRVYGNSKTTRRLLGYFLGFRELSQGGWGRIFENTVAWGHKTSETCPDCPCYISERSFSGLWHLKTYLQSTMCQARLNHVVILNSHKTLPRNRNLEKIGRLPEATHSSRINKNGEWQTIQYLLWWRQLWYCFKGCIWMFLNLYSVHNLLLF